MGGDIWVWLLLLLLSCLDYRIEREIHIELKAGLLGLMEGGSRVLVFLYVHVHVQKIFN